MGGILSPLNLYIEALAPNVPVFRDRAFEEVIRVKWGHRVGP